MVRAAFPRVPDLSEDDLLTKNAVAAPPAAAESTPDAVAAPPSPAEPSRDAPHSREAGGAQKAGSGPAAAKPPADTVFLNVRVPRGLRAEIKRRAIEEERTAQEIVNDALTRYLVGSG